VHACHTWRLLRIDIRDLSDEVVDAIGHLTAAGVSEVIRRIEATAHVPAYDAIVSDSILVAYGIDSEIQGRARPIEWTRVLGEVPVYVQMGRGFTKSPKRDRQNRFHLPAKIDRVLVITAGNDLFASGCNLADEIRSRVAGMKATWDGPESYVDVLVIEDVTWPPLS